MQFLTTSVQNVRVVRHNLVYVGYRPEKSSNELRNGLLVALCVFNTLFGSINLPLTDVE